VRTVRLVLAVSMLAVLAAAASEVSPDAVVVVGDTIPVPLTATPGDAVRGRAVVLDRANGNCLICHKVPEPAEPFQGDIGPDLRGVGLRLNAAELRLRLVDASRSNPATVMPPYYRISGLTRVDARYRGKPALNAQEIEDAVAYLATLRD